MASTPPGTSYADYTALVAAFNVYMLSSVAFFWYHRKLEFLQKRQPLLVAIHAVAAIWSGNQFVELAPFTSVHWPRTSGDIGPLLIIYLSGPLWLLCYFLRCISLVSQYYGNAIHVEEAKMNIIEKSMFRVLRMFIKVDKRGASATDIDPQAAKKPQESIANFSPKAFLKICAATIAMEIVMVFIVMGYSQCYNPSWTCDQEYIKNGLDMLPIYLFIGIYVCLLPYFIFLIRKVKDSYYLRLELQVTLYIFIVFFTLFIIDWYTPAFSSFNKFGGNLWLLLLVLLCHTVSVTIPTFAAIVLKRKGKTILVDHSLDAFNKILADRRLFAEFKQSLAQDFCIENALFLEDWMALHSTDPANQKKPADLNKAIYGMYTNYIRPGARYELNISSHTKKKIIQAVEAKTFNIDILEDAKKEVFNMTYLNSFPRFILRLKHAGQIPSSTTNNNNTKTGDLSIA
ncbi:hypothetical protein BKA69DRAFT_1053029 [Paraphysoderma sedebokerense]|nr:hypothetical protein BKA69DRAFT_1053029 [Paraphysoderma sedebokerense]